MQTFDVSDVCNAIRMTKEKEEYENIMIAFTVQYKLMTWAPVIGDSWNY